VFTKGGVDPHDRLGPIPRFMGFCCWELQVCEDCGQQGADLRRATATSGLLLENSRDDFGFVIPCRRRQLSHGGLKIGQHSVHRGMMLLMESAEFFQDRIRLSETRMLKRLIPSDTRVSQSTELFGNFDADGSRIDPSCRVEISLCSVIGAMEYQIVGNSHQGAPQSTVRLPNKRSVLIHLVALMPRRIQTRAPGDCIGIGIS